MDRFVVGTGRCGSTLVSRMLARHPELLSLSEFFNGLDMTTRFAAELSGEQLACLISAPQPFVTAVLRRGYEVAEVTYPFGAANARYATSEELPWMLVATLPGICADPDAVYDDVMRWAKGQPTRAAAEQYRALFAWLCERCGKSMWVERSGSAIDYLAELNAQFPAARFVHIHRDGPEVALSMREHHAYRLNVALRYDVPLDDGARPSEIGVYDLVSAPTADDGVSRVLRSRLAPAAFGQFWHDQVQRGIDAMQSIDDDRLHHVRFEDLVRRPAVVLEGIAEFLALERGDWIDQAAALVREPPAPRLANLASDDAAALAEVCRPARDRLRSVAAGPL